MIDVDVCSLNPTHSAVCDNLVAACTQICKNVVFTHVPSTTLHSICQVKLKQATASKPQQPQNTLDNHKTLSILKTHNPKSTPNTVQARHTSCKTKRREMHKHNTLIAGQDLCYRKTKAINHYLSSSSLRCPNGEVPSNGDVDSWGWQTTLRRRRRFPMTAWTGHRFPMTEWTGCQSPWADTWTCRKETLRTWRGGWLVWRILHMLKNVMKLVTTQRLG